MFKFAQELRGEVGCYLGYPPGACVARDFGTPACAEVWCGNDSSGQGEAMCPLPVWQWQGGCGACRGLWSAVSVAHLPAAELS